MCLIQSWFCPCCRQQSEHRSYELCPPMSIECVGRVTVRRPMKADMMLDWSCMNPACDYNAEKNERLEEKIEAIIEAQKRGQQLPPGITNPGGILLISVNPDPDPEPDAEMREPDSQAGDDEDNTDDDDDMDDDDVDDADDDDDDGFDPNAWRAAAGNDIPNFDAATRADIVRLQGEIDDEVDRLGARRRGTTWTPAEDDMLILMRRQNLALSYRKISQYFIPRHSEKGGESRRATLKRKYGR